MLGLYCVLVRSDKRPSLTRMSFAALIAAAMIAPWHIYQLIAHRQWFWADYVQIQLLGYGIQPPGAGSPESQAAFYFKRLAASDPVLGILLLTALPFLILALRGRKPSVAGAASRVVRNCSRRAAFVPIPESALCNIADTPGLFNCCRVQSALFRPTRKVGIARALRDLHAEIGARREKSGTFRSARQRLLPQWRDCDLITAWGAPTS